MLLCIAVLVASPASAQSTFAAGTPLQWPSVLTGAFLGFLLLPIAYNIVFFAILRERFLIWQSARVLVLIALTISLSSLPLGPLFSAESFERQVLINVLFDTSIAVIGLFLRSLLEPGMLNPRLYRLLGIQPWLVALTTPAMLLKPCPPLYMAFRDAVLLGILLLLCLTLALAIRRGSRAARYQAAAWSLVLVVCGTSLYHDIVLGRPFGLFLYALFVALAVEMLLTSIAIGDRFMHLKRQRDEVATRAALLDVMANTDPLTGLANRRAVEARFEQQRPNALAILDIDHFKQINDRFGHDHGDRVIIAIAKALQADGVFAARIGGEEFVLLIYAEAMLDTTERIRRQATQQVRRDVVGLNWLVTASAGITVVAKGATFQDTFKAADERLYKAKIDGRNNSVGPHGRVTLPALPEPSAVHGAQPEPASAISVSENATLAEV